jgi:hypothetical protein
VKSTYKLTNSDVANFVNEIFIKQAIPVVIINAMNGNASP